MGEIDEKWMEELTETVSNWFNDKGQAWRDILSEGLLVIPLADFLLERKWQLSGERSKKQIFSPDSEAEVPYVSYDLCAEKEDDGKRHHLLIDLKFLKPRKDKRGLLTRGTAAFDKRRIQKDVRDLVGASHQCERLFVVGIHPCVSKGFEENIQKIVDQCIEDAKSVVRYRKVSANNPSEGAGGSRAKIMSFLLESDSLTA